MRTATTPSHLAARGSATSLGAAVVVVALTGLALSSPVGADSSAPPASTTAATVATPTTTSPLSPLTATLGAPISVIPSVPEQPTPPAAIAIESIGLELTPVRPVGLDPDGQLEIPDETEVGWYRLGSWPGRSGATVLAAHVSWNDEVGPFYRLVDLEPGAAIEVELADGSVRTYAVVERAQYSKSELPADRVWTRSGPETLVLVTCGGDFNPDIRRYRHNIVVYAVPAG